MSADDEEPDSRGHRYPGGGTVVLRDPRVSRAIGVFVALLGTGAFAIGAWIGNTLMGLRESVAVMVSQNAEMISRVNKNEARDDRQEEHINAVDRRVTTMEGRTLRGPPEPRNGR